MKKEKETGFMCVGCGGNATEGSMKHPYCRQCFKKNFDNSYDKYWDWMHKHHWSS